ncbi:hypothetical protein [Halobacterium jilantaiense]|uniref:hypothetical protein n=1 Tax=Halobacterium jilantaiense TaxID=355548 RepID=UPI000B80299F|nr:hypothetical protein [Halobacterium jilantaiense]
MSENTTNARHVDDTRERRRQRAAGCVVTDSDVGETDGSTVFDAAPEEHPALSFVLFASSAVEGVAS